MFLWMINIGSFTELLFKDFCIDLKFGICLLHRKFNAKICNYQSFLIKEWILQTEDFSQHLYVLWEM